MESPGGIDVVVQLDHYVVGSRCVFVFVIFDEDKVANMEIVNAGALGTGSAGPSAIRVIGIVYGITHRLGPRP